MAFVLDENTLNDKKKFAIMYMLYVCGDCKCTIKKSATIKEHEMES